MNPIIHSSKETANPCENIDETTLDAGFKAFQENSYRSPEEIQNAIAEALKVSFAKRKAEREQAMSRPLNSSGISTSFSDDFRQRSKSQTSTGSCSVFFSDSSTHDSFYELAKSSTRMVDALLRSPSTSRRPSQSRSQSSSPIQHSPRRASVGRQGFDHWSEERHREWIINENNNWRTSSSLSSTKPESPTTFRNGDGSWRK